jgi:hypothetical protein
MIFRAPSAAIICVLAHTKLFIWPVDFQVMVVTLVTFPLVHQVGKKWDKF